VTTAMLDHHYNLYYSSSDRHKRQSDIRSVSFPGDTTEGVIGGLHDDVDYMFAMSVTLKGVKYEGKKTPFIPAGANFTLIQTIILPTSTISMINASLMTVTPSTNIQSISTVSIVGISLPSLIAVILLIVVVIETSLLIYCRRHTANPTLKLCDDIDMTASPAYGTTVFISTGTSNYETNPTIIYDTV
jgi:hypothetical protein